MVPAKTARTRSVGTKLTGRRARGLTVGEWVREVLLEAAGQAAPEATATEQALLSEVPALRTILLNLFYDLDAGEPPSERMQALIEKLHGDKREKALPAFEVPSRRCSMSGMWVSARLKGWPAAWVREAAPEQYLSRGRGDIRGVVRPGADRLGRDAAVLGGALRGRAQGGSVDRRGKVHPTAPAEVAPVSCELHTRSDPFRLAEAALQHGAVRLVNPVIAVDKARFRAFPRDRVYNGRTLADRAKPGMWWA